MDGIILAQWNGPVALIQDLMYLNLYQTTKCGLVEIERICRQILICGFNDGIRLR